MGHCFQDKWKLKYFVSEIQHLCLPNMTRKAIYKEFNIKRHYKMRHAHWGDSPPKKYLQDFEYVAFFWVSLVRSQHAGGMHCSHYFHSF